MANFEMTLKEVFRVVYSRIDRSRMLQNTAKLWKTELGQTFDCYHASAKLAESLLKEAGCARIERIAFPADGTTVFQDKTMPMGWRATMGRLEITQAPLKFDDPVVADFERHPFHLIKGSVSTPPEGIEARLISEEDLYGGADLRGAMVLLNPNTRPAYRDLRNTGILGIVSDNLQGRHETPTAIQWANACTESSSWHTRADEQPHIGFMVSPIVGDQLRAALREGEVKVKVFSDGERYEDTIEAVTGILPGEDEREIWLLAHLYEPMANDNSSGVACAVEILHALKALWEDELFPAPRFTLRLVFAMECYGFAAFAEHCGGRLRDKVLCALNLDALPILEGDRRVEIGLSQSGSPSCADYLLEDLVVSGAVPGMEAVSIKTEGLYSDDRLYGDSDIGVPTLWVTRAQQAHKAAGLPASVRSSGGFLWHNSAQDMSVIDPNAFHDVCAMYGAWALTMLCANGDTVGPQLETAVAMARARLEKERNVEGWLDERLEIESLRLRDFLRFGGNKGDVETAVAGLEALAHCRRKEPAEPVKSESQAWQIAETITITRTRRGLPRDFALAPPDDRTRVLPHSMHLLLVHADGRRTAAELLRRAQWEMGRFFTDEEIMEHIGHLQFLAKYGYISLTGSRSLDKDSLVRSLRDAGIRKGDLLLVHSGLSSLGVVEGGADTVIDALLEAVGSTGTLLMPAFTKSFLCFEKGPARNKDLVPFHPTRGRVWTGLIAQTFIKRAGVIRSRHPSHSIAGLGPLAEECLGSHGALDAPTGPSSPWAKLHELNGKIGFLGASLASCTFLHYLEDVVGVDYLVSSVCVVDDDEKGRSLVTIPRNVPGDRDFYRPCPEEARIFRRLLADGLKIASASVGWSEIKVIEAAAFNELGLKALRDDPRILLREPETGRFYPARVWVT